MTTNSAMNYDEDDDDDDDDDDEEDTEKMNRDLNNKTFTVWKTRSCRFPTESPGSSTFIFEPDNIFILPTLLF